MNDFLLDNDSIYLCIIYPYKNLSVKHLASFEHRVNNSTDTQKSAAYLDLHIEIDKRGRWFPFSNNLVPIH